MHYHSTWEFTLHMTMGHACLHYSWSGQVHYITYDQCMRVYITCMIAAHAFCAFALSLEQTCVEASRGALGCCGSMQIKLHFCFAHWDNPRTNPHTQCVYSARILGVINMLERSPRLSTLQIGPDACLHCTRTECCLTLMRLVQTMEHVPRHSLTRQPRTWCSLVWTISKHAANMLRICSEAELYCRGTNQKLSVFRTNTKAFLAPEC